MNKLILISLLALFSTGCFARYVHIHDRYPIYTELPERSVLPIVSEINEENKELIIKAVKDLKIEAAQLRAILDSYNNYAKRKNDEYDMLFCR